MALLKSRLKQILRPYWIKLLVFRNILRSLLDILGDPFIRRKFFFVQDQMASNQNMNALYEKDFSLAYERGVVAGGKDLRHRLRIHQAIWCAMTAKYVEGDFVELGTGRGVTFSAILKYLEGADSMQTRSVFLKVSKMS